MSQVSEQDVKAIREWLAKESHLPKDFSDIMLKKFIFSCFNSLEKAKKCIEMFCTHRRNMPEVYTNRDPAAKKIQDAFSTINVVQYDAGPNEILIHKLQEFNDKFDFYAAVMSFTLQADNWVKQPLNTLYDGQIIILDMQEYTLLLVPKCNVFYFQKFILFLLDGMPIRLKDIHLVNCPPYAEYMYNMVKGVLPEDIRNMVKFHTTCDSLRDCIDKKFLPEDYGGDAQCMKNENLRWVKEIQEQRDFYMNNDLWKADLSKKRKTVESETITNGSFRSLVID